MDIALELVKKEALQRQLAAQLSTMEQQKQNIVQEILRLDGEIRLLKRMNGQGRTEGEAEQLAESH